MKKTRQIPSFDIHTNKCESPQVILLGAGASKQAFPKGDRNGKPVPLMNELVELLDLNKTIRKHGAIYKENNFESFYSDLVSSEQFPKLLKELEKYIYNYFSSLELPKEPTIYDYLVLSLRGKDAIATFNWDPFLAQAYHRNKGIAEMPEIFFLHGNVEIAICSKHKFKGFINKDTCPKCNKELTTPSKLLYPVKSKNYNEDAFIAGEWETFRTYLKNAYVVTVFGYSAPKTDVEAKKLLLETWNDNPIREFTHLNIVDIKDEAELTKTWEDFNTWSFSARTENIKNTWLFKFPRRCCDSLFMANFQQSPWSDNPIPQFKTLEELHLWIKPLAKQEISGKLSSNGN